MADQPTGNSSKKTSVWGVVFALAMVVFVAALVALGVIAYSYFQGQQKYSDLANNYAKSSNIDWEGLRAINPNVVAWVYIPGTNVNYPVVQGSDNEYYLYHDFAGEEGWLAQYGAIFMDYQNNPDWSDDAYFLFGHHMNDGSMFADIAGMADQTRFDACRTVYLFSPTKNFQLRSFTLIRCDARDPIVQVSFGDPEDMTAYIQDKIDRSVVNVGEIPSANEITKAFALSTCDNVSDGRYVLYAYAVDEIE